MFFPLRLVLHVLLPGVAGFMLSKTWIIPQVMALAPLLPSPATLAVGATGLLTFAMAAVLRGWWIDHLRRWRFGTAIT